MSKVTITSLSKMLGVSISTVNKALNGKSGVSEEKRQEIIRTAKEMGYKANRVASSLARRKLKIGVVLPDNWPQYHDRIREGIYDKFLYLSDYNIVGVSKFYSASLPDCDDQVSKHFESLHKEGVNAIIFCPGSYHRYDAAMHCAERYGIPVVVIGIEFSNLICLSKIEVDANLSGRIAAEYLESILPSNSDVGIVIGSRDTPPHAEKLNAFTQRINAGKKLILCGTVEVRDNDDAAYLLTKEILLHFPHLRGLYASTGIIDGVYNAVVDCDRSKTVKIIATDIYPKIREHMDAGIVVATIYQNTYKQGTLAVQLLFDFLTEAQQPKEEYRVPPMLLLRENFAGDWENNIKVVFS